MKQFFFIPIVSLLMSSCELDLGMEYTGFNFPSPPYIDLPLRASAGADVALTLPTNAVRLMGWTNHGQTYYWSKISGPSSYKIDDVKAKNILVTNLDYGLYKFELRVSIGSDIAMDTVSVDVFNPNEYIFRDRVWEKVQGTPTIRVYDYLTYLPANSTVEKVFIQRDNNLNWKEIKNGQGEIYEFRVINNMLQVSLYDTIPINPDTTLDMPDIRILY